MNANQVLVKTSKGRDEIKQRTLTLSQHARNLLIAMDGQKSCGTLAQLYSRIPDVDAVFQELVDQGLVEPQGGNGANGSVANGRLAALKTSAEGDDKLRNAIQYLNDTINHHVGFGGFTLTLKVGRCHSLDDIRALIPDYEAAITKKRGADAASVLSAKLQELIR